jgi:hypothetical protein
VIIDSRAAERDCISWPDDDRQNADKLKRSPNADFNQGVALQAGNSRSWRSHYDGA